MDHSDILKLDGHLALSELGEETPTHIPDDIGFAKRFYAANYMMPLRVVRDSAGNKASELGPWGLAADELDFRMEVGYKTGSGNISSMLLDAIYIEREEVPLMTEYETFAVCGACKGSSGGCPGFAPMFIKMKRNIDRMFVFIVHYDSIWGHEYVTKKGWGRVPILRLLTYMDRLTDNYLNRLRKAMQKRTGCYVLGVGNCLGCLPSKCAVIKGLPCAHPEKRTFSMEATGIDCDELHLMIYGEQLPWYYQGTNLMPTYMSRYMAIFDEGLDYPSLLKDAAISDWSHIDTGQVPEHDVLYRRQLEVPSGVHKGYFQYVYDQAS